MPNASSARPAAGTMNHGRRPAGGITSDVAGRGGDGVGGAEAASAAAVSTGGLFMGPKGWRWRWLWWWQCRGGSDEGCGCGGNGDDWYTDEREWERRQLKIKKRKKKKTYLRGAGGATGVGGGGSGCDGNGGDLYMHKGKQGDVDVHRELACPEGWCGGDCGGHGGFEVKGKKKTYQHGTRQNDSRRVACSVGDETSRKCKVEKMWRRTREGPRSQNNSVGEVLPMLDRKPPETHDLLYRFHTMPVPRAPTLTLSFPHRSLQHRVGKTPPSLIRRDNTMARDDMSRCNNLTTCKNRTGYEHRPPRRAKPRIDVRRAGGHDINMAPQPYGTAVRLRHRLGLATLQCQWDVARTQHLPRRLQHQQHNGIVARPRHRRSLQALPCRYGANTAARKPRCVPTTPTAARQAGVR
ncbi:hypothetical protein EDB89DRAFT_1906082 [Lactarius sanguifluus]|nr:hypothetical protein EDB89DRAFT_1906082 [Lactarius sanguifluus]